MSEKYIILDSFDLTGRGRVYIILIPQDVIIYVGDTLFDSHNNRFIIREIDMIESFKKHTVDSDKYPVGIFLDNINGVEVYGNVLTKL